MSSLRTLGGVIALVLFGALPARPALAQGSPSAAPSAKPADKKDDKKKSDDKKKADDKKKGDAKDGGVPAGHPAIDPDLPAGHPAVDDEGDDGQEAGEDPHGKNPHGGSRGGGNPGFFEAPEDTAADDPALPVGTVIVSIRDAQDKGIPRAPMELGILHNTVAKGEKTERRSVEVDEQGTIRFDELEKGAGVSYRVTTPRGPATFEAPAFSLGDKSGKRVVLHSYEVATQVESLRVGMWGVVYLQLREDSIAVEHHFTILNVDPIAWVPQDFQLGLPPGFKAFTKPEEASEARFDEVKDEGAALHGTIAPGQHELTFRYQVPLDGAEKQSFKIRLPAKVFQIGVMAEASKTMGLEVSGFPSSQRSERNGKRLLVTKKQANAAGDELKSLEITMSGLPTPGPGRWISVSLGLCALGGAAFYVTRRREDGGLDKDARDDLIEARRALLDEIVALERAHRKGAVGPKTFTRVRAALVDALGRIVAMLEASPAPRKAGAAGAKRTKAKQATT